MHKLLLDELSFSYAENKLFDRFSYTFEAGAPYLISGASGRGKTTLLHLIAGLLSPSAGSILGGGIGNCSLAFQEPRLFPTLSALENAALVSTPEKAAEWLSDFSFDSEDLRKLPGELSGGMQQRASLARAFLAERPILLLDEPTRGLDPALRQKLAERIKSAAQARIVIAVSHDEADRTKWNAIPLTL